MIFSDGQFRANSSSIVVIGGGLSGWLAALELRGVLPSSCSVQVVAASTKPIIGVGESSTGLFAAFLRRHGITASKFVQSAEATFKLGINFEGWQQAGRQFFAPIDNPDALAGIDPSDGTSICQRAAIADGLSVSEAHLHSSLIKQGRVPVTLVNGQPSILGTHAWHFDAGKAAKFVEKCARERGVIWVDGDVIALERNTTGAIESLCLADGRKISAEYFLDCSGQHRVLMREYPSDWKSLKQQIFVDRAVAGILPQAVIAAPATSAIAAEAGWLWKIPVSSRIGVGYVYASNHISDDEAWRTLLTHAGEGFVAGPSLRFDPGFRQSPWTYNGIAIGMASGFFEPLQSTSLHLTIIQVMWIASALAELLNGRQCEQFSKDYNRWNRLYQQDLADFIALHYSARDDGTEFWTEAGICARRCELYRAIASDDHFPSDRAFRGESLGLSANLVMPTADGLRLLPETRETGLSERQRLGARKMRAVHNEYSQDAISHAHALSTIATVQSIEN